MSIISKFSLDASVFSAVLEEPELFERRGSTTRFNLGVRTPYKASINGVNVPAYVTLEQASLTRLSLLKQTQAATGREYDLVTGIFKPVRFNIELIVDGQTITLIELMNLVANEATGRIIPREEFIHSARQIGLNYEEGMPLFFQQFGASYEGFKTAAAIMKEHGAVNTASSMKNRGRIAEAWQMPKNTGIPVTSLELGTVDRTQSARFKHNGQGQGFLNLVEAQIEQFSRIVGLRKQAKMLEAERENLSRSGANQAEIKGLSAKITELTQMSEQWQSNWAGAQRRLVMSKNGSFTEEPVYDPVNAPCGRFTMNEIEIDLWTNSLQNRETPENRETPAVVTDSKNDDDDFVF